MRSCIVERKVATPLFYFEVSMTIQDTVRRGKEVYETIRPTLELRYPDQYVSIDPISKEYFIDDTLGKSLAKARARFPERVFYSVRIGRETAVEFQR